MWVIATLNKQKISKQTQFCNFLDGRHRELQPIHYFQFVIMYSISQKSIKTSKQQSTNGLLLQSRNLELPNISKPINRSQSNTKRSASSLVYVSMADKVKWITENVSYEAMNEGQIRSEHRRLRQTLKSLNQQVAKILEKSTLQKSPSKPIQPSYVAEVRSRQIDNNQKMLIFYKVQYAKLQKRISEVGQGGKKDNIDNQVRETKEAIEKAWIQIKQSKKVNSTLGNRIVNSQDLVKQMRKLEEDKTLADHRKAKLAQSVQKTEKQLEDFTMKEYQIIEQYEKAEEFLKSIGQTDQKQKQLKSLQIAYNQKKITADALMKKIEQLKAFSEQNYLKKLKVLQSTTLNINKASERINLLEKQLIESKTIIKELQDKLKLKEFTQADKNETETFFLSKPLELTTDYKSPDPIQDFDDKLLEQIEQSTSEKQKKDHHTIQICENISLSKRNNEQSINEDISEIEQAIQKSHRHNSIQIGTQIEQNLDQNQIKQNILNKKTDESNLDFKKKLLLQKLERFQQESFD